MTLATVGQTLLHGSDELRHAGSASPDLDARLLMAAILDVETSVLLARRERLIEATLASRFFRLVDRRAKGEPVHRIIGRRGFFGHDFALSSGTLEPRPDTETVVELAIEVLGSMKRNDPLCFIDIGTGSGAIGLSILAAMPTVTCIGTDISDDAVRTAEVNAHAIGVAGRFTARVGEYSANASGPLDLVVSNPPYIPSGDIEKLSRDVQDFDPLVALDGGVDGMVAYRAIAGEAPKILRQGGSIVVEIGIGQQRQVADIFDQNGYSLIEVRADLAGVARALHFTECRHSPIVSV